MKSTVFSEAATAMTEIFLVVLLFVLIKSYNILEGTYLLTLEESEKISETLQTFFFF